MKTLLTFGVKVILSFSLFFLIAFTANNHPNEPDPEALLKSQALLEDFVVFQNIYEKANAGLYKYHSKRVIDSVFAANKKLLHDNLTHREFYNILWNVIDYTGSCHNKLEYPFELDSALNAQKIFFPIPLIYIDGKLYSNAAYKSILLGSEILSINGMSQQQFAAEVSKYSSTDGHNQTGKYHAISTDWLPFYAYLVLDKQDQFEVEFKTKESPSSKTATIKSMTYEEIYSIYDEKHSTPYENRFDEDYAYHVLDSLNTGLLNVQTFAMGGPKSEGHKRYAAFLDSVFTTIKTSKINRLIVDLRGNGGGHDPNDLLLYSYLTKREFRENKTAFTLFQEIPLSKYYVYDDVKELKAELEEEHSIYKENKYYQNASFNRFWKPKTNAFTGKTILLIDPDVASGGSLFASLVKSDTSTVVIGEETAGGYYGHTGHIPVTYELPNSKFEITFSIVDIEQDVRPLPDERAGDGVMPDFRVVQSYADFMNHTDNQLQFAIEYIQKSNAK